MKLSEILITKALKDRFWPKAKITADEQRCWEWDSTWGKDGYGLFKFGVDKRVGAHRVAYYLHNNFIEDDKLVCHKCDNRGCVNPNHLFLGTPMQNSTDMKNKDRHCCGERNSRSKLTKEKVIEIRTLASTGVPQSEISKQFNISQSQVSVIVRKKHWAHIQ